MLGRIGWSEKRQLFMRPQVIHHRGLPLATLDIWRGGGGRTLARGGAILRRAGVRRVLVPQGFDRWETLQSVGLQPVETGEMCRAMAGTLALAMLGQWGIPPQKATVALWGDRVTRTFAETAHNLCPHVRHLVIEASQGGQDLSSQLRRQWGMPSLEASTTPVALTVAFAPGAPTHRPLLDVSGANPDLGDFTLSGGGTPSWDTEPLPLLTALWETGRISTTEICIIQKPGLDR